jgi:hypothetical protein
VIHAEDRDSLLRILGCNEVAPALEKEYELRLRMFHSDGNSGPLRTVALIDLVRSLGLAPPHAPKSEERIDWRQYPQDGSVRVEARFFGGWMPGAFIGFVHNGTLAIRIDDDPMIRECRPDMVRLATEIDTVSQHLEPVPAAPPAVEQEEAFSLDDEDGDEADTEPDEETPPEPPKAKPLKRPLAVDWSKVQMGAPVLVEADGDVLDGFFDGFGEMGSLRVSVAGQPRDFHPSAVLFSGS